MATKLKRTYTLPYGKTMEGAANAIEGLFHTFSGCAVTSHRTSHDSWKLTCVSRREGVKGTVGGVVRKHAGIDMDTSITLYQTGNKLEVHYLQDINELSRLGKGLIGPDSVIFGIPRLVGIYDRNELPGKINEAIRNYLNG